ALKPKGIRVYIPDEKNFSLFVFQGNVNRKIGENDVGNISGEVTSPTNGRWIFEDPNVQLKPGDVVNYYVHVVYDGKGFLEDNLSFTVQKLEDPSIPVPSTPSKCRSTVTEVRNGKACAGQVIFEDTFESFREDFWLIEQYIPEQPDYPFVSYQRSPAAKVVSVDEGNLKIKPKLLQNLPGFTESSVYSDNLDLISGCTSRSTYVAKCSMRPWGATILPPVVSGRITTKSLAFKFGIVEIRAKLPQGEWLYPDILLEPLLNKYGFLSYASGAIRIAGARGNEQLTVNNEDKSNKVLYGGPIMDFECRQAMMNKKLSNKNWGDEFHVYSVIWEPGRITLTVDGEEWSRVEPTATGLQGRLTKSCQVPRELLSTGTNMAPFDDFFYVTLGVAVGGISEFEDGSYSSGRPKPWRNGGRKAAMNFWQDKDSWYPTWSEGLIVDYVRVKAL
ncbi:unnamed protein product, partial [Leptidea sinapis]